MYYFIDSLILPPAWSLVILPIAKRSVAITLKIIVVYFVFRSLLILCDLQETTNHNANISTLCRNTLFINRHYKKKSYVLFCCNFICIVLINLHVKKIVSQKLKVSPLQAMKAHGGCACKDPHIHSHSTRKVASPTLGRLYSRGKPPVLIL